MSNTGSQKLALLGIVSNIALATAKITAGVLGNSFALIADGIESSTDIFGSAVVYCGLRIAARPPDKDHPYGHAKAESLAAAIVSLAIVGAGALIAWKSIENILDPNDAPPAPWTLLALFGVIAIKTWLFRKVLAGGHEAGSQALKTDAWHHSSDAITSAAAAVGIIISILGGPPQADDWAALLACLIIFYTGFTTLKPALDEIMDAACSEEESRKIVQIASEVPGVVRIEKYRVRKAGSHLYIDIHVWVDGRISVYEGHIISHAVKNTLANSGLRIFDVVVHLEPDQRH